MRTRGFTLLELIVVIAIFGVMSAMAYGGLSSVLKTRVHVEQSLERTGEYQKAFMRLRNDFQNAHNRPARDPYGTTQPAFIGDSYGHVTLSRGGWRNPLSQPRASIERVSYYLDKDKKGLIRSSYRVLDQAQDSKPVDVTLLENVTDLSWRFLDSANAWQTTWPPASMSSATSTSSASSSSTQQPPPPQAVEITMHTDDMGELRFLFRLAPDPLPQGFQPGLVTAGTGTGTGAGTTPPTTTTAPPTNGTAPDAD